MAIRVILIDDGPLVRAGLAAIIDSDPGLEVVGEGGDGAEAVDLVTRLRPDVVVMDVHMPRLDGLEATRLLVDRQESPRVLILTTFNSDDYVFRGLACGSRRLRPQTRSAGRADQSGAYRGRGEALLYPQRIRDMAARSVRHVDLVSSAQLSSREQEVLTLMARGMSNAEIAVEMFLGAETVKTTSVRCCRSSAREIGRRR